MPHVSLQQQRISRSSNVLCSVIRSSLFLQQLPPDTEGGWNESGPSSDDDSNSEDSECDHKNELRTAKVTIHSAEDINLLAIEERASKRGSRSYRQSWMVDEVVGFMVSKAAASEPNFGSPLGTELPHQDLPSKPVFRKQSYKLIFVLLVIISAVIATTVVVVKRNAINQAGPGTAANELFGNDQQGNYSDQLSGTTTLSLSSDISVSAFGSEFSATKTKFASATVTSAASDVFTVHSSEESKPVVALSTALAVSTTRNPIATPAPNTAILTHIITQAPAINFLDKATRPVPTPAPTEPPTTPPETKAPTPAPTEQPTLKPWTDPPETQAPNTPKPSSSGSNGNHEIKFTYYGDRSSPSSNIFMCGKSGYANSFPDPSNIIAISQTLGLQLFSQYMTQDQISSFQETASPMCLSTIQINGGPTYTIYDVCDDTNGCVNNDIDFWDQNAVHSICGGGDACIITTQLNAVWNG